MYCRSMRRASGLLAVRSYPSKLVAAIAVLLVSGIGLAPARGGYTPVNPATPPEKSTNEILAHIYGGSFAAVGNDYTNGVITAHRIMDTAAAAGRGTQPLNL